MRMMQPSKGPRQSTWQNDVTERRNSYEAPIGQQRGRDDFDSTVRDEMNRLEQKIKSIAIDRGPTSSSLLKSEDHTIRQIGIDNSSQSYCDHHHHLHPSTVELGSGAEYSAKQVEYKRQMGTIGKRTDDASGRMRNTAQSSDWWKNDEGASRQLRKASFGHGHQENEGSYRTHDGFKLCSHSKSSAILKPQPSNSNDQQSNQRMHRSRSQNPIQQLFGKHIHSPIMKTPTPARVRVNNDMYGASSVIVDSQISNQKWKPSLPGQGDERDRKRLAALEHKNALDEQVAQDRRRKQLEKDKDRQSDDRAMQKIVRQHDDERERARLTRDAIQIALSRVPHEEKFSEDALARHNRNTRSKAESQASNKGIVYRPVEAMRRNSFGNGSVKSNGIANGYGNAKSPANGNGYGHARSPANGNGYGKGPANGNGYGNTKNPANDTGYGITKNPANGNGYVDVRSPANDYSYGRARSPAKDNGYGNAKNPANDYGYGNARSPANDNSDGYGSEAGGWTGKRNANGRGNVNASGSGTGGGSGKGHANGDGYDIINGADKRGSYVDTSSIGRGQREGNRNGYSNVSGDAAGNPYGDGSGKGYPNGYSNVSGDAAGNPYGDGNGNKNGVGSGAGKAYPNGHDNGHGGGAPQAYNSPKNELQRTSNGNAAGNSAGDGHDCDNSRGVLRGYDIYDSHRVPPHVNDKDYQKALNDQMYEENKYNHNRNHSKGVDHEAALKEAQDEIAFMGGLRGKKPLAEDGGGPRGQRHLAEEASDDIPHSKMMRPKVTYEDDAKEDAFIDSNAAAAKSVPGMGSIISTVPHNDSADKKEHSADYIERLPLAMGNVLEPGRRAATPGGALECKTQLTNENTMMRPYTPGDDSRKSAYPEDIKSHNNASKHGMNNHNSKNHSDAHADDSHQRSPSNLYGSDETPMWESGRFESDYISPTQAAINEKIRLVNELSMASKSLLLYPVNESEKRPLKPVKRPMSARTVNSMRDFGLLPDRDPVRYTTRRPSTSDSAANGLVLPAVTFQNHAPSPVPAPLHAFDYIPSPIEPLSPVHAKQNTLLHHTQDFIQRIPPNQSKYAYNHQDDSTDSDSDWEEGPCKWCHGDYYPCRCDEKGRNTASMAQKSSPPHSSSSKRFRSHPIRNHSAQLSLLSAIKVTIDGIPCKWCLGTFVPCFCEYGIPDKAVEQFDNDPADSSEVIAMGNGKKTFMSASGSRMDLKRSSLSVKTSVTSTSTSTSTSALIQDERTVLV